MRGSALALVVACALGACNQNAPGGDAPQGSAPGVFPNLFQTAYRAEGVIAGPEGQESPVVMIRDGQKMRMEMTTPQGDFAIVINHDTDENFMITQMGGRPVVMRQSHAGMVTPPEDLWSGDLSQTATAAGPCAHAGETGTEWRRTDANGEGAGCVTADGIILWASQNGTRTWNTTAVQRGPQDPSLFAIPPGVQVLDPAQLGTGMQRP